ncbi:MAG: hypothetical protein COT35_12660 [Nitrospirae bacterium CG08_land_8_20_14_0_20_52_24]|nr:MAG: hypothetical protein COT35_12660 [Nitrospirae bacterium CG08_land_8_20_14_0_20_52_24]
MKHPRDLGSQRGMKIFPLTFILSLTGRGNNSSGKRDVNDRVPSPLWGEGGGEGHSHLKICYFGTYEKNYPRNRVIIEGLRRNGVEVIECHYPLWEREHHKTGGYLSFINLTLLSFRLLWGYIHLCFRYFRIGPFDILMVGYIGQMDLLLAKLLNLVHRRPLVFNPLISLYDTLVLDRGIFRERSVLAKLLYYLDKWSMKLSDLVILDTDTHIEHIAALFHVDRKKFIRVFVGAEENLFYSRQSAPMQDGVFRVLFYGKYIPLHGIHHILHAAKALEGNQEIRFQMIGKGQLSREIRELAKKLELRNIEFIEWVRYEELPGYIHQADVCLGIFGDTDKARRVIPNKVFQCLAMGKPVVTRASQAFSELLTGGHDVLFCEPPYIQSIKESILRLKEDAELKRRLSENALELFRGHLAQAKLTAGLAEEIGKRFACNS